MTSEQPTYEYRVRVRFSESPWFPAPDGWTEERIKREWPGAAIERRIVGPWEKVEL